MPLLLICDIPNKLLTPKFKILLKLLIEGNKEVLNLIFVLKILILDKIKKIIFTFILSFFTFLIKITESIMSFFSSVAIKPIFHFQVPYFLLTKIP